MRIIPPAICMYARARAQALLDLTSELAAGVAAVVPAEELKDCFRSVNQHFYVYLNIFFLYILLHFTTRIWIIYIYKTTLHSVKNMGGGMPWGRMQPVCAAP